jgi:hypothetical protein
MLDKGAGGFHWTTFDLTSQRPEHWQPEIAAVAAADAEFADFPRTPSLSREAEDVHSISRKATWSSSTDGITRTMLAR